MKDSNNGTGSVTGLELGGEWVRSQILPRTFFVGVQSIIDYELKVGR
jgi:hypothetical protein